MNERKKRSARTRLLAGPDAGRKEVLRTTLHLRTVSAVLLFLGLMTIATPAAACSTASLKGNYGFSWGWPQELYGASGNEGIVVGRMTADGKGNRRAVFVERITFIRLRELPGHKYGDESRPKD